MAQTALLLTFLLGIGLLVGVAWFAGRGRRGYTFTADWAHRERPSAAARAVDSPAVWTVGFVTAALAFGLAAVAFVGDASVPEWLAAAGGVFLAAAATLVFVCYLFYGTFVSARNRGLKNSQAALLGSWAIGALLLVAITFKLLGAF